MRPDWGLGLVRQKITVSVDNFVQNLRQKWLQRPNLLAFITVMII